MMKIDDHFDFSERECQQPSDWLVSETEICAFDDRGIARAPVTLLHCEADLLDDGLPQLSFAPNEIAELLRGHRTRREAKLVEFLLDVGPVENLAQVDAHFLYDRGRSAGRCDQDKPS
jgi:hypothetical protein